MKNLLIIILISLSLFYLHTEELKAQKYQEQIKFEQMEREYKAELARMEVLNK